MDRRAEHLARNILGIGPDKFPLGRKGLLSFKTFLGDPYGYDIPETYDELLGMIRGAIQEDILLEHQEYLDTIPRDAMDGLSYWQSLTGEQTYHYMREYMEDPIGWRDVIRTAYDFLLTGGRDLPSEEELEGYVQNVNAIIAGAPPIPRDIIVFRSVVRGNEFASIRRNRDYTNKSFTSTTTWYFTAVQHAHRSGKIIKIIIPEGSKALYMGGHEKEILLPANTHFELIEFVKNDDGKREWTYKAHTP